MCQTKTTKYYYKIIKNKQILVKMEESAGDEIKLNKIVFTDEVQQAIEQVIIK